MYTMSCAYLLRLEMILLPARPWLGKKVVIPSSTDPRKTGIWKYGQQCRLGSSLFASGFQNIFEGYYLFLFVCQFLIVGLDLLRRLRIIVLTKFPYRYNVKPIDQS